MKKNQDHSLQCIDILLSALSPPSPFVPWSKLESKWSNSLRRKRKIPYEKPVTTENKHLIPRLKKVLSASDLSSARGRISRETRSQSFQGEGQALETILTRQLSNQLNNLELIPRGNERVSVIVPNTPSRSPRTSTPSGSPSPSTNPPNQR